MHDGTRACPFRWWRVEAFYAREASAMAASDWGMCQDCQWWQIDPGASISDNTMGVCTEEELQPFRSICASQVVVGVTTIPLASRPMPQGPVRPLRRRSRNAERGAGGPSARAASHGH
jgi:hypothetical protein